MITCAQSAITQSRSGFSNLARSETGKMTFGSPSFSPSCARLGDFSLSSQTFVLILQSI
nr:MAG TPA: hypothetical protein [Caudoviricetes sp.]